MPQVLHTINNPVITIADTEAGLTGGDAIHCQMTAATMTVTEQEKEVPQSGCYPPSTTYGDPKYALETAWIQDWADPSGISRMAQSMRGTRHWISYLLDEDDATTAVTAEVTVLAGQYGGTFGELALATSTWAVTGEPTFPAYTAPLVAAASV